MSDLISRQVLELWNRYKPTIAVDAIEYDRELKKLLGTNLTEVGTDCISRQAAIDAIEFGITYARAFNKETGEVKELFQESNDELRKAVERIKQLPPIQPKRGKWIYGEDSMADCVDGYRCDQCGFFVPWDYQHKSIDYIKDYNFCPKCGSYNGGEQDG